MENKWLQKWGLSFLLILIGGLTFQMEATAPSKVELEGDWKDDRRSVPFELPVSAFVDGNVLTIQSCTADVDITVVVSQNGVPVYEKAVPASQTTLVVVDMDDWAEGSYVLELKNELGGYLWGIYTNGDFVY